METASTAARADETLNIFRLANPNFHCTVSYDLALGEPHTFGAGFAVPPAAQIDFSAHIKSLQTAAKTAIFRVFLCGPKLSLHKTKQGAAVRKQIREALQKESFEVILGEDEGLTNKDITRLAINAQDNELIFIKNQCSAVIIVAESVGSHCELGLFSWHFASSHGLFSDDLDLILLVDKKYRRHKSYFNLGPLQAVKGGKGVVKFVDFNKFDVAPIIKRLNDQRGITRADKALNRNSDKFIAPAIRFFGF